MGLKSIAAAMLCLALAAGCNAAGKPASDPVSGDAFLGPANAKVVMTEFAAPTCPVCKGWHDQVFSKIRANYIDTNKIKFVLRELPSHNPPVDAAIFGIARCAGQGEFFKVIDDAFDKRDEIEKAAMSGDGPRGALTELAKRHGVSADRFEACVKSPDLMKRLKDVEDDAQARGVEGTPTLFIDGQKVPETDYMYDALSARLDAALAAAAPAPAATTPAPADATPPAAPAPAPSN
ncbi:MAG: thioredoxin domain-containing protein [Alphaproteobacteria bacterium]|nr:thioredoxin domain-containing protein [Alphaproteobacteria bacterium]